MKGCMVNVVRFRVSMFGLQFEVLRLGVKILQLQFRIRLPKGFVHRAWGSRSWQEVFVIEGSGFQATSAPGFRMIWSLRAPRVRIH